MLTREWPPALAPTAPSCHDDGMRLLHLVAGSWWTGSAATALQLVEALRAAGVDARFAFQGGNNLETRLGGQSWAHPILVKERSFAQLRAEIAAVREFARGSEIVHAHLPHDHFLARVALTGTSARLVRGIHAPRHLRADPYHAWLLRGCAGFGVSNATILERATRVAALRGKSACVLGAAAEPRFHPGAGREARARLGIPPDALVAGTIGKLDRGRGHDLFLHALAATPGAWGLVIGAGPWAERLEKLARALGISARVTWAGYVDDGLEDLYRAMDLFVFPAAGSDHGHRAIVEASACGLPTLGADLGGVRDLVEPGVTGDVYAPLDAAALAVLLRAWLADPARRHGAGDTAAHRAREFRSPSNLAAQALRFYREVLER